MQNAILFWGFELASPPPWGNSGQWAPWALERLGMPAPTGVSPDEARARAEQDVVEETGCRFSSYGAPDAGGGSHFVAIAISVQRIAAGKTPSADETEVDESWLEQLQDFCEELEVPWSEPGWRTVDPAA